MSATNRHFLIEIAAIAAYESWARHHDQFTLTNGTNPAPPWKELTRIQRQSWRSGTDHMIQREYP